MQDKRLILRRKLVPPAPATEQTVADVKDHATALGVDPGAGDSLSVGGLFVNGVLVGTVSGRVTVSTPAETRAYFPQGETPRSASGVEEFRERLYRNLMSDFLEWPDLRSMPTMYTVQPSTRALEPIVAIQVERIRMRFAGLRLPRLSPPTTLHVHIGFPGGRDFLIDLTTLLIREWATTRHPLRPRVEVAENQVSLYPPEQRDVPG